MTCEEFEMAGLGLDSGAEDALLQDEARVHLRECARCAALHETWQSLRTDLRALGAETQHLAAPARVEMRLRQEYRAEHQSFKERRTVVFASWTLAAAVLLGAFSVMAWRNGHPVTSTDHPVNVQTVPAVNVNSAAALSSSEDENAASEGTLVAVNDTGEFTPLPGVTPALVEGRTVVRVRMQRGTLGELGLAVNEERAADWIQVDLLVGDDGQPEAVRVPEALN